MGNKVLSDNKRIAKNSILLYLRMLLVIFIGFFTSREVLRILGEVDYGIYNVVGGVTAMLAFLHGSLGTATVRFITYEIGRQNFEKIRETFSNAFLIHVGLATLIVIILETIGLWFVRTQLTIPTHQMHAAIVVFHLSIISCWFQIVSVPFTAAISAYERLDVFAYIGILEAISRLIVVYCLLFSRTDKLILYGVLSLAVTLLTSIIYALYCIFKFPDCRIRIFMIKSTMRKMLSFASWDLYGNFSIAVRGQGVNILQNIFFGPIINAASGVANTLMSGIMGFANNFLMSVTPQIIKSYSAGNMDRFVSLIYHSSKFCTLMLFFISFPIFLEADFVMKVWLSKVPSYSASFCQLVLINNWVSVMFRPVTSGVQASGHIRTLSIVDGTIYLLVLPISWLILKVGGSPNVPFILNILLLILGRVMTLKIICRLIPQFRLSVFIVKSIIPTLLIMLCSSVFPLLIRYSMPSSWFRFIYVTSIAFIITGFLTYRFGLSSSQRHKLLKLVTFRKIDYNNS